MAKRARKKEPEIQSESTGGVFFFLSLLSLLVLAVFTLTVLPSLFERAAILPLFYFLLGTTTGCAVGYYFIQGRLSVFIHEFKHSLVSHFVGNKSKEMKVRKDSGHFTYQYSKETAKMNAFISLAPYCLPIFTIPALGIALLFWWEELLITAAVVGLGYGIDALLNSRDISPHQTDITGIRGGYWIGLLYILAMNLVILGFLLSLVMQGPTGPLRLVLGCVAMARKILGLEIGF